MADYLWDPDDGPDPREYDDCDEWTDDDWQAWYDDQPGPSSRLVPFRPARVVVSINPFPYL